MNGRKLFVAIAISAALLTPSLQAQIKIGVVNLKNVFDGYYKTKQSDQLVKDRQAEFQKNREKMLEDYQTANEEYKKFNDDANDPAISSAEQTKLRKQAESKLLEIREIEQSISNLDKQWQADITEQINRMRQNILRDIQELLDTKARAADVNLVIDTAAESVNRTPVFLFSSGLTDLTPAILDDLNRTAPAGALSTGAN